MHPEMERINQALAAVREKTDFVPEVGVILGSGLGAFGDMLRREAVVSYADIPGFPRSTVPSHAGRFVFGWVEDTPVVVMQGRVHLYESTVSSSAAASASTSGSAAVNRSKYPRAASMRVCCSMISDTQTR